MTLILLKLCDSNWSVDAYGGYSLNVIRGMHDNSKDYSYFGLLITNGHIISCSCHICMLNHVYRTTNVDTHHLTKFVFIFQ